MTAYAPAVNVEKLVIGVLTAAGVTNVHAERIGDSLPFVLVAAAGGPSLTSDGPGWVQISDVQIDAWAATKGDALDLIQAASSALRSYVRIAPVRPEGVLVRATVPQPNYVPDSDVLVAGNPAPRYLTVATIYVRPTT